MSCLFMDTLPRMKTVINMKEIYLIYVEESYEERKEGNEDQKEERERRKEEKMRVKKERERGRNKLTI